MATGLVVAVSTPTLIVRDETAGKVVLCQTVSPATRITLIYTHSMFGGDVIEEFVPLGNDRLRRLRMSTANEAAAEYYAYEADVIATNQRFIVDVPRATFGEIVVRVDRVGHHRLGFDGTTIDLLAASGDRHQVRFFLQPVTVLQRMLSDACEWSGR